MTDVAQPAAIETREVQGTMAIDRDDNVLPLPDYPIPVTVHVIFDGNTPRFSLNQVKWYSSMSWSCGGEYSLFIQFVLDPGVDELTPSAVTPCPWFSAVSRPSTRNQYVCVPWVTSQTTYHFTVNSGPLSVDPQIVVTPVTNQGGDDDGDGGEPSGGCA